MSKMRKAFSGKKIQFASFFLEYHVTYMFIINQQTNKIKY